MVARFVRNAGKSIARFVRNRLIRDYYQRRVQQPGIFCENEGSGVTVHDSILSGPRRVLESTPLSLCSTGERRPSPPFNAHEEASP